MYNVTITTNDVKGLSNSSTNLTRRFTEYADMVKAFNSDVVNTIRDQFDNPTFVVESISDNRCEMSVELKDSVVYFIVTMFSD